ncbi:MAG: hypothetical protein ACQEQF_10970 [Bacillota bacterium]
MSIVKKVLDLIFVMFDSILEFFAYIFNIIIVTIGEVLGELSNVIIKNMFPSTELFENVLNSFLKMEIIIEMLNVFQWTAFSLVLLKILYDLNNNFNFRLGSGRNNSAFNKLPLYIMTMLIIFNLPELFSMLVTFHIKLLSSLEVIASDYPMFQNSVDFTKLGNMGMSMDKNLFENISNLIGQIMIITGVVFILFELVLRSGRLIIMLMFGEFIAIDLTSGKNPTFSKLIAQVISDLMSMVMHYMVLMVIIYIAFTDKIPIDIESTNKFIQKNTKINVYRLMMIIGTIIALLSTRQIIENIMSKVAKGSSESGLDMSEKEMQQLLSKNKQQGSNKDGKI